MGYVRTVYSYRKRKTTKKKKKKRILEHSQPSRKIVRFYVHQLQDCFFKINNKVTIQGLFEDEVFIYY